MTKLTIDDCALNAADALTKAADGETPPDYAARLLNGAIAWTGLLDAMRQAGMQTAQRAVEGE